MAQLSPTREEIIEFTCNICGKANALPMEAFDREAGLCAGCNSTVRYRSIAYLMTKHLLGSPQVLRTLPAMGLRGVGLSCSEVYATVLEKKLQYTNTYFDREPYLDINDPSGYEELDFVISSDVFEHTMPPAKRAFEGASRILKEEGLLALTVPFSLNEQTIEHYPECTGYRQIDLGNDKKGVELQLRDGSRMVDEDPVWHGGIGKTLEMRVFSRDGMFQCLEETAFEVLEEFAYGVPRYGIVTLMRENWALPVVARKRRRLTGSRVLS
jgi:hypothetical protein